MRIDYYDDFNPKQTKNSICHWLEGLRSIEIKRIGAFLGRDVKGTVFHMVEEIDDLFTKKEICQAIQKGIFEYYRENFRFKKPLRKHEVLQYLSFLAREELLIIANAIKEDGYHLVIGSTKEHHIRELRTVKVDYKKIYRCMKQNSVLPGHKILKQSEKVKSKTHCDLKKTSLSSSLLNTTIPLETIIKDVGQFYNYLASTKNPLFKNYNLLFYGAPGTGKTMFASTLAQQLGRPLITLTASDLLSHYVGETEEFIAGAFAEAKKKKAILFLDEMDAILGDRDSAGASWERSQVNEFLVQMERFEGVFIASTNYSKIIDKALDRRFAHKIGFEFLKSNSLLEFFAYYFNHTLNFEEEAQLVQVTNLAPGDFKVALQRCFFREDQSAKLYLEELLKISQQKKRKPIGLAA